MLIQITDPVTQEHLSLLAVAEESNGVICWRIHFPQSHTLVITQENGQWKVSGEACIDPELLDKIGRELHPLALAQQLNRKRLDKINNRQINQ